jgi:bifunctional DNase/RNase
MDKAVVEVEVKGVLPTSAGCAVFIGNDEKVFVIYTDQMVGAAITMFLRKVPKERPQTHDLVASIMDALGAKVERVVVCDFKDGVYYGRLILTAENEINQKMIVEIDARPSDCIALAVQQSAPILISEHVWAEAEDMTDVLSKVTQEDEPSGLGDLGDLGDLGEMGEDQPEL